MEGVSLGAGVVLGLEAGFCGAAGSGAESLREAAAIAGATSDTLMPRRSLACEGLQTPQSRVSFWPRLVALVSASA